MGTRARVGIVCESGTILTNWVNRDGYDMEHQLNRLFPTIEKAVQFVVGGGEISSLWGDKVQYYQDVSPNERWKCYQDEQQFVEDCKQDIFISYGYLYKNGQWNVVYGGKG